MRDMFEPRGRVFGRVIACGWCPCCKKRGVVIHQDVIEWKDPRTKLDPTAWGAPQMSCSCGATILDVTFPLDERWWQLLLDLPRERKKIGLDFWSRLRKEKAQVLPFPAARQQKRRAI